MLARTEEDAAAVELVLELHPGSPEELASLARVAAGILPGAHLKRPRGPG